MSNKGYHTKKTTGPGGESVWLAEYRGVAGVYGIGATEGAAIADLNGDSPRADATPAVEFRTGGNSLELIVAKEADHTRPAEDAPRAR